MSKAELKKLQAKWYKKLAKSGFKDIEESEDRLKQGHGRYIPEQIKKGRLRVTEYNNKAYTARNKNTIAQEGEAIQLLTEAKQRYYELARQFCHEYEFKTAREASIWAEHAEGVSARSIAKRRRMDDNKVFKLIAYLEGVMLARCKA